MRWPLREALLAMVERRRAEALDQWRFETLVWSVFASQGAKKKAPEVPAILRESR